MTSSRPASRPVRLPIRILFALLLTASTLPTMAQDMPTSSLAGDSADAPAATTLNMQPESMTLSDRALLLATDFNRLLAPGTAGNAGKATDGQSRIKTVLQRALALLGTPYRWGGTSPDKGFDCSGLVGYVFRNALGIELPRVSREMAQRGELISDRANLNEGDLVFFGKSGQVDHVGIYVGEGRFVHAPRTGKDVMVSSLETGYWSGKYLQARRVHGI